MVRNKTPRKHSLRGSAKKEAFHQAAESKVQTFRFDAEDAALSRKSVELASLDSCRARIQVLRKGTRKRGLHYHPNQDQIYMVLKGRIRFYGPDDTALGELGPFEGIVYPENSRYWLENAGEEETWLLHFSAFPLGAGAARAVNIDTPKPLSERN